MTKPALTILQERILKRLDAMKMNPYEAAKAAGLGGSFVRDILRGKTHSPSSANLAKLAETLQTSVDYLQGGRGPAAIKRQVVGLPVVSEVNAGSFRDVTILDEEREPELIPVAHDTRFPKAKQYALRIRGDSMDLEFPDGTYVTCVDFWDAGVEIREGLRVHVERTKAGGQLVEITIKAIEARKGTLLLVPKSRNPRWKPIPINGEEDTEIAIKGIVTGSWRPTQV